MSGSKHPEEISIDKLYPDVPADKRATIEANLMRYLEIVRQIHNEPRSAAIDRKQGAR